MTAYRSNKLWLTLFDSEGIELFEHKIQRDVIRMAKEAYIYNMLWNPLDGTKAYELVMPIVNGVKRLQHGDKPESAYMRACYDDLVEGLLLIGEACTNHPGAVVHVSSV